MIDVNANPILRASFERGELGVWDVAGDAMGFVEDAGAVTEEIVTGGYDFLVPLVMIGVIAFALSEGS
jgi:hypothetical protein